MPINHNRLTKGPYIRMWCVNLISQNLGRNEIGRSANVSRFRMRIVHRQAKVGQLGDAILRNENIAQFEIPVDDSPVVDILERVDDLKSNSRHVGFGNLENAKNNIFEFGRNLRLTGPLFFINVVRLFRSHSSTTRHILM